MKNAKRWLSVLLSVAVVLTMAITPAMAAGADNDSAATITVETAKQAVDRKSTRLNSSHG